MTLKLGQLRPMIEVAKTIIKPGGIIAEIGVERGEHARQICQALKPYLIYLVDIKKDLLREPGTEYIFIEKESVAASVDVIEKLDLIYIDALEDEYNTIMDIACWYPKLKVGGIIGGHDYKSGNDIDRATKLLFGHVEESERDWWHVKTKEGFYNA